MDSHLVLLPVSTEKKHHAPPPSAYTGRLRLGQGGQKEWDDTMVQVKHSDSVIQIPTQQGPRGERHDLAIHRGKYNDKYKFTSCIPLASTVIGEKCPVAVVVLGGWADWGLKFRDQMIE